MAADYLRLCALPFFYAGRSQLTLAIAKLPVVRDLFSRQPIGPRGLLWSGLWLLSYHQRQQLEQGLEFQDFVSTLFFESGIAFVQYSSKRYQFERGENSAGIEIKFDDRFEETHNLYIEVAEKSHPGNPHFIPSGIYRSDNGWLYAIGNYKTVDVFLTRHLQWIHTKGICVSKESLTSKGFLLPQKMAQRYAARILKSGSDLQIELPL